jgi:hypothetical protein
MLNIDPLKPALAAAALVFSAVGLWMVLEPAGFQTTVGGFGATNEHLIGDLATFNLALAGVLGTAAVCSSWRLTRALVREHPERAARGESPR